MPNSSNRTRTYRSGPRYDHNMGVLDTEIAQVAVPPDGTTKRVSESDGTVTPTDRLAEEYIDPKEERAFVNDIRTELNMKWLTICQVWRLDAWFISVGFLGYTFKYLDQTNIVRPQISFPCGEIANCILQRTMRMFLA